MKSFFPSVPIMATTATLQPERQDLLCQFYLRNPVVARSTVNKPNMRIKVLPYEQLNRRNIKARRDTNGKNINIIDNIYVHLTLLNVAPLNSRRFKGENILETFYLIGSVHFT